MRRAYVLAIAMLSSTAASAQFAEPVRPPTIAAPPVVIAPPVQPLPLTPSPGLSQAPTAAPMIAAPLPAPATPLQVVPPPPPAAAEGDSGDGSDSCDCYVWEGQPLYQNGVIVGSQPVRRFTGKSPQCCPQQ
jgi:hypothetical protein